MFSISRRERAARAAVGGAEITSAVNSVFGITSIELAEVYGAVGTMTVAARLRARRARSGAKPGST